MTPLTVGQVAETYGVTVRTLHHYDQIGLLSPSERSHSGYRLYTADDLERLQHVVVYRRLGFPLEEVAELLADVEARGSDGAAEHLRRQRAAVMTRLDEMRDLVRAIDDALERTMTKKPATTEDLKQLFGDGYHEDYQAEAEQRWGDTPQWRQSQERQASMTKDDWAAVKADTEALERDLAAAVRAGEPTDGDVAAELAERHRRSIEVHYDCPHAFQVKLAEMYLADPRFTQHYEDLHAGLAQWLHDAIVSNAARHGA
ncbi:transcriptional regulator [Arsenicicoccus sp. oral taxon 190]|nr:transcriptional regulator [Arsenicicoccus sp. oral taxon 190]